MKKKMMSMCLALSMIFALSISAGAVYTFDDTQSATNSEHLINEDGSISDATMQDIDELTHERNLAVLDGDTEKADALLEELKELGGRTSTDEEIMLFADPNVSDIQADNIARAKKTSYLTYTYSSTVNGKSYSVKRVDTVASTNSNLYHSGVVAKKTSGNAKASVFGVCKAIGAAVAGAANSTASNALSVYSALQGTAAAISSTTVVTNISASYTYQIQEYCSFYSYKDTNGVWTPFAVGSYADMAVTATVLETTYAGGGTNKLNNVAKNYYTVLYATNSKPNNATNNTANLLKSYLTNYRVNNSSRVLSATIQSNGKTTVWHIGLVAPTTTSELN